MGIKGWKAMYDRWLIPEKKGYRVCGLFRICLVLLCIELFLGMVSTPVQALFGGVCIASMLVSELFLLLMVGCVWLSVDCGVCIQICYRGLSVRRGCKFALVGFIIGGLLLMAGVGLSVWLGVISWQSCGSSVSHLLICGVLALVVACAEELLFRGYVWKRLLEAGFSVPWVWVCSSLLFALVHVFNPAISLVSLVNIGLAGLLLGLGRWCFGGLWFCIGLHAGWNWVQGTVLGYGVSGYEMGESLWKVQPVEMDYWSGGEFGFEASLICTLVLILAVAVGKVVWNGKLL